MPRLALLALAVSLSACASGGLQAPPTPPTQQGAAPAPPPFDVSPGRTTPQEAIAALGEPRVDRREGAGALLTWRSAECALTMLFSTDGGGVLRLVETLARDPASRRDTDLAACAASLR